MSNSRHDELFYGGESVSHDQPQAFTCPFCGKMGFTESSLHDHVTSEHSDTAFEVVCPICAALPGGEPNNVTDDFAAHLTLEHRPGTAREVDENSRHGVRRIMHSRGGVGGGRVRRSNMPFSSSSSSSNSNPGSSAGLRDSVDPIAELLSQLSGVRRTATASSQLQQLQVQLQLERQQAQAARQQLERWPRRQPQSGGNASNNALPTAVNATGVSSMSAAVAAGACPSSSAAEPSQSSSGGGSSSGSSGQQTRAQSQFLLARCLDRSLTDSQLESSEVEAANRAQLMQELILATLASPPPSPPPRSTNTRLSPNQRVSTTTTTTTTTTPPSQTVSIGSRKLREYGGMVGGFSVPLSNRGRNPGFRNERKTSGPRTPHESRNHPSDPH